MLRQLEKMQMEMFVDRCFQMRTVTSIMTGWRVEQQVIKDLVCAHLREMGIQYISPFENQLILGVICHTLKNSQDIVSMVNKADVEEKRRQQNRHSSSGL
jgi:hypothetical protein